MKKFVCVCVAILIAASITISFAEIESAVMELEWRDALGRDVTLVSIPDFETNVSRMDVYVSDGWYVHMEIRYSDGFASRLGSSVAISSDEIEFETVYFESSAEADELFDYIADNIGSIEPEE